MSINHTYTKNDGMFTENYSYLLKIKGCSLKFKINNLHNITC